MQHMSCIASCSVLCCSCTASLKHQRQWGYADFSLTYRFSARSCEMQSACTCNEGDKHGYQPGKREEFWQAG